VNTLRPAFTALSLQDKGMGLVVETGSGGLTKFNRAQRGLPKARLIDAACVGKSTPEKVEIANVQ